MSTTLLKLFSDSIRVWLTHFESEFNLLWVRIGLKICSWSKFWCFVHIWVFTKLGIELLEILQIPSTETNLPDKFLSFFLWISNFFPDCVLFPNALRIVASLDTKFNSALPMGIPENARLWNPGYLTGCNHDQPDTVTGSCRLGWGFCFLGQRYSFLFTIDCFANLQQEGRRTFVTIVP